MKFHGFETLTDQGTLVLLLQCTRMLQLRLLLLEHEVEQQDQVPTSPGRNHLFISGVESDSAKS